MISEMTEKTYYRLVECAKGKVTLSEQGKIHPRSDLLAHWKFLASGGLPDNCIIIKRSDIS